LLCLERSLILGECPCHWSDRSLVGSDAKA
jgi:hypothetical protein